jgi:biopolymer transport protein ExbB
MQFYHQGGQVGYAITVLLIIGCLIALERILVLGSMSSKIKTQTKNLEQPNENNPLGRLLKVYFDNKSVDAETLELKLDEAILRETPKVDRGINLIKMFAAIAPLMGLLGTVIGMIMTFQTIMLFGTGDPKIMAGNISLALVTTALGLICALPLILIHSVVAGKSKAVLQKLDEQSAGLIAAIAEKESA